MIIGTKFLTAGLEEIGILLRDRTEKNVIVKPSQSRFHSDPVSTPVFDPRPNLNFGSGLAFDSDPGSVLDLISVALLFPIPLQDHPVISQAAAVLV
ncbi:hypothetical protein EVAR_96198_1 [Eumeta japonica]|uniref:Uncharacterized protein n=1 Tax=Eumeta variegata TaxID=151549 RepID=A0A4C1VI27_EUMVA|nr:hypothetical protein EVAR_96198_1 [Eumeta japonica]